MWIKVHEIKEVYNREKNKWETVTDEDGIIINMDKIHYVRRNKLTSTAVIGLRGSEIIVSESLEDLENMINHV